MDESRVYFVPRVCYRRLWMITVEVRKSRLAPEYYYGVVWLRLQVYTNRS